MAGAVGIGITDSVPSMRISEIQMFDATVDADELMKKAHRELFEIRNTADSPA
jgi:hypothetical protein